MLIVRESASPQLGSTVNETKSLKAEIQKLQAENTALRAAFTKAARSVQQVL